MKKYPLNVKILAVSMRRDGDKWAEIRQAIKEKYSIEPPTTRVMLNWLKGGDNELIEVALREQATKQAENIKRQALESASKDLLPRLIKSRAAGENVEYSGWHWMFTIMETTLGSEKFWNFIDKYRKEKEGQDTLPESSLLPFELKEH